MHAPADDHSRAYRGDAWYVVATLAARFRAAVVTAALHVAASYTMLCFFVFGYAGSQAEDRMLFVAFCELSFTLLYAAAFRATVGMSAGGLVFGDVAGAEVGGVRASLRVLVGFALLPLLPVSVIVILAHPSRRSLADWVCGTRSWVREPRGAGFAVQGPST